MENAVKLNYEEWDTEAKSSKCRLWWYDETCGPERYQISEQKRKESNSFAKWRKDKRKLWGKNLVSFKFKSRVQNSPCSPSRDTPPFVVVYHTSLQEHPEFCRCRRHSKCPRDGMRHGETSVLYYTKSRYCWSWTQNAVDFYLWLWNF